MSLLTESTTTTTDPGTTGGSGGTTTTTASWKDSLPEDIRGHSSLSQIQDMNGLARSYIHAQSMVGKKGVVVPGEKATDEEWGAFYKSIGQPEADKYEIAAPKDKQINPDMFKAFKEMAHKSGLLPKQAQKLFDWYAGQEESAMKAQSEQKQALTKQELADLQKEWGGGYDKNISLAKLAVDEVGGPEFKQYLEQSGLGNDVRVIKLMSKVGALLGEDKIRGQGGGSLGQTPAELNREITDIMGNKSHPYHDPNHPSHKSAVNQMSEYYKKLSGG